MDHWKKNCPMKKDKRDNGGNLPRKPGTSANIVEEDDCFFVVEYDE